MKYFIFLFIVNSCLWKIYECVDCTLDPKTSEGRLRKKLFCKYDKSNRPTLNGSATVIKLKMVVKGFNFDEDSLHLSTCLYMSWTDDNLKWTPAEYGNLESIVESSEIIWQPDLALFNSDISSTQNSFCKDANCVVDSSGKVSCIPPCLHSATCNSDISRFPFDTQNCTLHIGTWENSGDEVDFSSSKLVIPDANLMSQNRAWKLVKASYRRNHGNYSTISKQTYPYVSYAFVIERHDTMYWALEFTPSFLMILLNLTTLWLSPDSIQRMLLLFLVFTGHMIMMQELSWNLPHAGDESPKLLIFYRNSLIITSFLLMNTYIVRTIALGYTGDVPAWIGSTTKYLGSNKIGQLFLSKNYLIEKEPLHSFDDSESVEAAVPQQTASDIPVVTLKKSTPWQTFAKIYDRTMFLIIFLIYFFSFFNYLPEGYFDKRTSEIEITGY